MSTIKRKRHLSLNEILRAIGRLGDETGVEVYAVGGFVRDRILGKESREIDFVVVGEGPKFARKAMNQLKGKGFAVFQRFGTASFLLKDIKLEFVSARQETYHEDSRKPIVEKGDLNADLQRRDFTINTLAMGLNTENYGEIIDIFNGRNDLENKVIRTPLNPEHTFSDDPLRIMRAARFASQLDFEIEPATMEAMGKDRERLEIVSQERITDELLKMLSHSQPSTGIHILQKTSVLEIIFPELAALKGVEQRDDYHHKDVFEHTMKVVDNLASLSDNILLRFTAMVHDIGKPRVKRFVDGAGWTFHGHELVGVHMLRRLCKRLKLPNEYLRYSQKLTRLHMRPIHLIGEGVTDSAIRRLIVQAGEEIDDLMTLCRADITSGNPLRVKQHLKNFDVVAKRMKEVEDLDRLRAFQSPVRGGEIMELCHLESGPLVGKLKKMIEEAILEGQIPNEHDAAYEYLLSIKDKVLKNKKNKSDR